MLGKVPGGVKRRRGLMDDRWYLLERAVREHSDGRPPCRARARHRAETQRCHSAHREDRNRDAGTGCGERTDPRRGDPRLRTGREDGPEQQIVEIPPLSDTLALVG